jgi:hypothetical protein
MIGVNRCLILVAAALLAASPAVAQVKTKAAIQAEITTNLPNNNVGFITPAIMRGLMTDVLNSYLQGSVVNAQTGTTYTVQCSDMGALLTFANASPVAVSLPSAATACFNSNWVGSFKNNGVGNVTITPVAGTINGAANLVLTAGQGSNVVTDGTNWQTWGGSSSSINPWVIAGSNIYYVLGNVGIGTITPAATLDVNGTVRFDSFPSGCLTTDGLGNVSAGTCASLIILPASRLATTTTLPTNTYANGSSGVGATLTATANAALSIDSVAVATNDVVLIKNEAAPANNGIYTVTQTGDGSHPYILTRATNFDTSAEMVQGSFTSIVAGTVNASTGWALGPPPVVTVGATSVVFNRFNSNPSALWLPSGTSVYYLAGNVGIGTSTPSAPLDVFGPVQISGSAVSALIPNSMILSYEGSFSASRVYAVGANSVTNGEFDITVGTTTGANQKSLKLLPTGVVQMNAYTSPGCLSNDASGNISSTACGGTASSVTYTPQGTGGVATTVKAELDCTIWANDYGAVCNGSTDDHTAFQNAINEGQSLGLPVRFVGSCAITTGLAISSSLDFGSFNGGIYTGQPRIVVGSTSITAITVTTTNGNPVYLHDFGVSASSAMNVGVPTIVVTGTTSNENSGSRFERLVLNGNLSVGISFVKASVWTLTNSVIATGNNSIVVANTNNADSGDSTIYGNFIQCGTGTSGILWTSSGGLRIENNKILCGNGISGVNIALASGATTADLFIIGNSIEGISTTTGAGVQITRSGATGALGTIMVASNELSGQFCLLSPTDANGVWVNNLIVNANNCVTPTATGFSIDSVQGLVVTSNFIQPTSGAVIPVSIGTHGPSATNCVIGPNPHLGTAAASVTGSCTAISPN